LTETGEFALIAPVSEPTPQNEPASRPASAAIPPEADLLGKISDIGKAAYEKTVSIVRGRGRPRKDGSPKISDTIQEIPNEAEDNMPGPGEAVHSVAASPGSLQNISTPLIRRCLSAILKSILAVPHTILYRKAARKQGPAYAEEFVKKLQPTEDELSDLAEFSAILLKKYNVDTQYAPEVVAGLVVIGIGSRTAAAFVEARHWEEEEKAEQLKRAA
jgi:hypothetical protein